MTSKSVYVVSSTARSLEHLFTKIRDQNTTRLDFCRYCNRLMTIICEEGLSFINPTNVTVTTPVGVAFEGTQVDTNAIVAVSIIRAGDSLLECFMNIVPEAKVGKILIQRNEETKAAELFYSKLPSLATKNVVLLDPMLATGGSAKAAIQVLLDSGAREDKIFFLNVVSCPEGLQAIHDTYPTVQIVTGAVDSGLNDKAYIVPGLGDYGDRFYGTEH